MIVIRRSIDYRVDKAYNTSTHLTSPTSWAGRQKGKRAASTATMHARTQSSDASYLSLWISAAHIIPHM